MEQIPLQTNMPTKGVDFDLDFLDNANVSVEDIPIKKYTAKPKKKQLSDVDYKLKYLAGIEDGSNLEGNLIKGRNEAARGGKLFEIILLNKTCLVLRREYIRQAKLLVIIPEKATYNIYNELTGELLHKNSIKEIEKFIKPLSYDDYTAIDDLMVMPLFSRTSRYDYNKGMTKYTTVVDNYSVLGRIKEMPEAIAIASKTKYFLESKDRFYKAVTLIRSNSSTSYYDNQRKLDDLTKIKLGFKLMVEGLNSDDVNAILGLQSDTINFTDINVVRNVLKLKDEVTEKLKATDAWARYSRMSYSARQPISITVAAKLRMYNIEATNFVAWVDYIYNVEEYNIIGNFEHYFDVLKQQVELNNGKIREKYPKMWLSYENKIQSIYRRNEKFLKEKKKFTYSKAIETLEHITAKDNQDWKLMMTLPRTYGDLIEEASGMKNCVAAYGDRVYNHETVVLLLRNKRKPDKSYVTVEANVNSALGENGFNIVQVKGISNTTPDDDAIYYLYKWSQLEGNKDRIKITDYYVSRKATKEFAEEYEEKLAKAAAEEKLAKEEAAKAKKEPKTVESNVLNTDVDATNV